MYLTGINRPVGYRLITVTGKSLEQWAYMKKKNDAEEACWLGWYCVDPDYRGKQIGAGLLEFAIDEAKKENKKYLRVYTSPKPERTPALNIYQKYGFKVTTLAGKTPDPDTIYLEKKL